MWVRGCFAAAHGAFIGDDDSFPFAFWAGVVPVVHTSPLRVADVVDAGDDFALAVASWAGHC